MRFYPAKLLLFGEHLLLLGATALAVPIPRFSGGWAQKQPEAWPENWRALFKFAATLPKDWNVLDVPRLQQDVMNGLYFDSDIPQGYGLGSSGALCAALYDRYGLMGEGVKLTELQQLLASIESRFHGRSSGIDPLTSYLNTPLLITGEPCPIQLREWPPGTQPQVFLIDTRQTRQTGPLVQWFLKTSQEPPFSDLLKSEILPCHEAMVDAFQRTDPAFWTHLKKISAFQLAHFKPMLPADPMLQELWKIGLTMPETAFKICGAGGGGFLMGFTLRPDAIRELVETQGFSIVFPFLTPNYG